MNLKEKYPDGIPVEKLVGVPDNAEFVKENAYGGTYYRKNRKDRPFSLYWSKDMKYWSQSSSYKNVDLIPENGFHKIVR